MTESNGPTTRQPATKTRKPTNKVAIPRLYNAVEDIVKEAELDVVTATIGDLYDAFEAAIVKAARGL